MKYITKHYFFSFLILLICTLFSSLILTILKINNVITYNSSLIIGNIISYIMVAILSYIIGFKLKKHGLLHGFLISIILLIFNLIFFNSLSNITNLVKLLTKSLIAIVFSILGVNTSK